MFRKNIAVFTLGLVLALASVMANATVIVRIADDGFFGNEVFEQISPTPTTYIFGTDYTGFQVNFMIGDVTGALGSVDNVGCFASDFGGFSPGNIALIERGACVFSDKVNNAAAAGAIGAIIYDNIVESLPNVIHQDPTTIPSIFITRTLGLELLSQIPEPTTLALMGLGLAGIGYRRRKAAV